MKITQVSAIGRSQIYAIVYVKGEDGFGLREKHGFTMSPVSQELSKNGKLILNGDWKITSVFQGNGSLQIGDTVSIKRS